MAYEMVMLPARQTAVKTTPIPVLVAAITDSPICKTTPVEGEVFIDESKQTFKTSENDRCT